jgi:hypothetical protein
MVIDELVALLGYKVDDKGELKKFDASLKRIEQRAAAIGGAIRTAAVVAGTAAAAGFAFLGKGVIDTSSKFETYQTTLETIEGSAEQAKKSMDWVANFAKTTPFDVDQATEAFVKLKAYGIDPLKDDTLKVIGDTASAMGKDLMQAVEAWADAMTGENERLKEFGVKAKKAGEQITYTWTEGGKEVSKTIKDNREEILKFLNSTMGKRFAGAMERQSKTWKGMVSNLGDTWMGFLKMIGDAGFFDAAKAQLRGLMDLFERWEKNGLLGQWAQRLSAMFTYVLNLFSIVGQRIATHLEFISSKFAVLQPYIKAAAATFGVLLAICFPVITALALLALGLEDFLTYLQGGDSAIGAFITSLGPLGEYVKYAAAAFGVLLAALFPIHAAVLLVIAAMGDLISWFQGGPSAIRVMVEALGSFGAQALAALTSAVDALRSMSWAEIGQMLARTLLAGLVAIFSAGDALTGLGANLIGTLTDAVMAAEWAAIGLSIANALWTGIKALAGLTAGFWGELGMAAVAAFEAIGSKIGEAIYNGLVSVGGKITAWFSSLLPDWAKGFFGGAPAPGQPAQPSNPVPKVEPQQPNKASMGYELLKNMQGNLNKTTGAAAAPVVNNDHSQDNRQYPVTVQAPVSVTVQGVEGAGAAAGAAVGAAIGAGIKAQPARFGVSPSQ